MVATSPIEARTLEDLPLLCAYFENGARDCMDELMERHMAWMYRLALGYARNSADAEEAVQATFLELLQHGRKLAHGKHSNLRGWLARVLIRTCRGKHKSDQNRRAREARAGAQEADMESSHSRELLDAALQTITGLPERYRLPVSLHFIENWSYKEIAQSLELEEDTVRQQANRGLDLVRQSLLTAGFSAMLLTDPGVFSSLRQPVVPASLRAALRSLTTRGEGVQSDAAQRATIDASAANPCRGARRGVTGSIAAATLALLVCGGYIGFKARGTATPRRAALTSETADTAANGPGLSSSHSSYPAQAGPDILPPARAGAASAPSDAKDPKGPAGDVPAAAARASASKLWQKPRFIPGDFHPLSLSMRGTKLVLLTAEAQALKPANHLVIFESEDGGQTWSKTTDLKGYLSGYGDFDQDSGDYAILGLTQLGEAPTDGLKAIREKMLTANFHGRSADLLVRKAAGTAFDAPLRVWKTDGQELLQTHSRLFCANRSWWAFQPRVLERTGELELPKHTIRMRAAHGENAQSVKPVADEWEIPGQNAPVAWAKNERTAGFVTRDRAGKLRQYVTRDGGQSWQDSVIPFSLSSESGLQRVSVNPSAIAREGDQLLLLVFALFQTGNELGDVVFQRYALTSTDLGETWTAPLPASPRDDRICEGDGVHILNGQLVMCEVSNPGLREELQRIADRDLASNKSKLTVRMSDDGGKTWSSHNAFTQLGDGAEEVLLGGDATSLHVCIFLRPKADFKATGCLVVRSFAPGNWSEPQSPPDWFKAEQTAPAATHEEF